MLTPDQYLDFRLAQGPTGLALLVLAEQRGATRATRMVGAVLRGLLMVLTDSPQVRTLFRLHAVSQPLDVPPPPPPLDPPRSSRASRQRSA